MNLLSFNIFDRIKQDWKYVKRQHLKFKRNRCNHNWQRNVTIAHGKEHAGIGKRTCTKCGLNQIQLYRKFGKIKYKWIDHMPLDEYLENH